MNKYLDFYEKMYIYKEAILKEGIEGLKKAHQQCPITSDHLVNYPMFFGLLGWCAYRGRLDCIDWIHGHVMPVYAVEERLLHLYWVAFTMWSADRKTEAYELLDKVLYWRPFSLELFCSLRPHIKHLVREFVENGGYVWPEGLK